MHPTHYCTECGALWRQCDNGSWNLRSEKAMPCCDNVPMKEQIKPLAAPSAQAEPVRQLHSFSSIDCEKLIAATVPGGSLCDPQEVADSIRRYLDAWPSAQAEPQVPLPEFLTAQDKADLLRIEDCFGDDEGYDLPRERMKRLAELGVIRHNGGGTYSITAFGMYCTGAWPVLPLKTFAESNAEAARLHAERMAHGIGKQESK